VSAQAERYKFIVRRKVVMDCKRQACF